MSFIDFKMYFTVMVGHGCVTQHFLSLITYYKIILLSNPGFILILFCFKQNAHTAMEKIITPSFD